MSSFPAVRAQGRQLVCLLLRWLISQCRSKGLQVRPHRLTWRSGTSCESHGWSCPPFTLSRTPSRPALLAASKTVTLLLSSGLISHWQAGLRLGHPLLLLPWHCPSAGGALQCLAHLPRRCKHTVRSKTHWIRPFMCFHNKALAFLVLQLKQCFV